MEHIIVGYEPSAVFNYFEEICKIPRGSGNEKAVSDYLVSFASARGLACIRDQYNNVIISMPGSKGSEDKPAVMLQGHMDMVCEKNAGTVHDFAKDPIKLKVSEGWVSAEGTTLGADNGIAVAFMLAVLDDKSLVHPPLECVFTVEEETGLTGAENIDLSNSNASYLINLDSEDEGTATVSCCGGIRARLTHPIVYMSSEGTSICLTLSGLCGGHSGMDIDKGHANANKLMGQVLNQISAHYTINIVSINGGNKDNAIPRECSVVFTVDKAVAAEVIKLSEQAEKAFKKELKDCDSNIKLSAGVCENSEQMFNKGTTADILTFINICPNGVRSRSAEAGGFVETSINFASISTNDDVVEMVFSARSVYDEKKKKLIADLEKLGIENGFTSSLTGDYCGWSYEQNSTLRDIFCEKYRELFETELKLESIHAGLECGLFKAKLPKLDIIAVGPTVIGCHTPEERLDLESCTRVWKLLSAVLAALS